MKEITLTINGKLCRANSGDTILKAATDNDIFIPTLCHNELVKVYGGCGLCVVSVEGSNKLLRACSTVAADGMVVNTESSRAIAARKIAIELIMSDHEGDCRGPCTLNCPAGTDCQRYVKQIALGNDHEAVRIIKDKIPFPASLGRICPHPCETECRRGRLEAPISIAHLKAYAADMVLKSKKHVIPNIKNPTGKTVGIIGGGPGGLSCAYQLARLGHCITVYDAMPQMGGMFRYGIPEYRMPKAILDIELAEIESMGIKFVNNCRIGHDITLSELRERHDAVVVAVGAWKSASARTPGEELKGVISGIDLLRSVSLGQPLHVGKRTAVVGGGNTAMDACRTAVRCGAEEVYIIYRRTRSEMPAEDIEIDEAIDEGVTFKFLTNPAEILGQNGRVCGVKLQIMELGEPDDSGRRSPVPVEGAFETLELDSFITAIGQKPDISGLEELHLNKRGNIESDESTFLTNLYGVFAVGDATNQGASIAIDAVSEGNRAAVVIDSYLSGCIKGYRAPYISKRVFDPSMLEGRECESRAVMPTRSAEERKHDFNEVNLGFDDAEVRREATRCLECGCHDYEDCHLIKHANIYEIRPERLTGDKHPSFKERKLINIERDQGKCLLCGLCVRICDEVVGRGILGLVGRGFSTTIKPEFNSPDAIKICADCKKCAQVCPTGALKIL